MAKKQMYATKIVYGDREWIGDFKPLSCQELVEREKEITNILCGFTQTAKLTEYGLPVIFSNNVLMNSVISIIKK